MKVCLVRIAVQRGRRRGKKEVLMDRLTGRRKERSIDERELNKGTGQDKPAQSAAVSDLKFLSFEGSPSRVSCFGGLRGFAAVRRALKDCAPGLKIGVSQHTRQYRLRTAPQEQGNEWKPATSRCS